MINGQTSECPNVQRLSPISWCRVGLDGGVRFALLAMRTSRKTFGGFFKIVSHARGIINLTILCEANIWNELPQKSIENMCMQETMELCVVV